MKDKAVAAGVASIVVLLMIIVAKMSLFPQRLAAPARLGEYQIFIPQSCVPKVMAFTHGKSRIEEMPVQDFLNLKNLVESKDCGGKMKMVEK